MNLKITSKSIEGIVTAIPAKKTFNEDIDWLDLRLKDRLISAVGINERRVTSATASLASYATTAAKNLLEKTHTPSTEIGVLVLVTQTGDQQVPNTAISIQSALKLPEACLTLEVNMGCSGFVHGLYTISQLLNGLPNKKGLLITGDFSSRILANEDSGTVPLFSDAVSATLVSQGGDDQWDFVLANQAEGREAIAMQADDGIRPFDGSATLRLDGHKILSFGLKTVVPGLQDFLSQKPTADAYLFHQASKIINDTIRKKLHLPEEKCPESLSKYGNTSSATIPLTMSMNDRLQKSRCNIVLCGFGTGLSWGGAYLNLSPVHHFGICEI
ncbi:3-oxoacyl-[acyl-carrier-protein] synthase III C-terminal domain-containing protein [Marinoscillum furvescens]|uniref:3-oxoacyl-[acyl-carrier-protein] synthase-3 n=1 Tax=Marinoscillum furvescens DSM 4134 TaxID=1122208 RepID=A0A3D9KXH9_MARFU|nr:3-oxoacyl-[acyl-carrier-protein] synthase III C-terminal domain-containing protein [Marinoscillum furvescens]RED92317.1 3-oxoacyl-[acyl-carrier-protein] synthase-3 [Marinoscillum furvescens DSM 4134]